MRQRKPKPKLAREPLEIALRAFVPPKARAQFNSYSKGDQGPSEYSLIFDCETTTDPSQRLRFGCFQLRKFTEIFEAGIFYDPDALSNKDVELLREYARTNRLTCVPVDEFIDRVFYGMAYDFRATIVGLNLPFDISRLAINHGIARGKQMGGGFTFKLSKQKFWPNVQIKHLSNRSAFIQFTTRPGRFDTRGMRRRQQKVLPRRGYFLDLRTLAGALTSHSFSLKSMAEHLNTNTRKLNTEEHGGPITGDYIRYALQDVQVTWECYQALLHKYALHKFTKTLPTKILSEASVGKAYFREMNIRPWREVQPDFSNEIIGIIMSSYFGGRSEVHARRIITQVAYCDFLSMYPTVCTLMGLWRFIISEGVNFRENTKEIRELINSVTLADIQKKEFWPKLRTLVQILPDDDILPVRAPYGADTQLTIGLNYLKSKKPVWVTLADAIASKLVNKRTPKILKAITFEPKGIQQGLNPIDIAGNSNYRIHPEKDDFFKRAIELRSEIKLKMQGAKGEERARLDTEQLALKIIANSTSYGIFIELNVEDLKEPETRLCFGYSRKPFKVTTSKAETPGQYFHPLLATLITGGARLMLAVTETLARENGLDWAFCDTDSMAIAKTEGIEASFNSKIEIIRNYFIPLNPYSSKSSILKLETANFGIGANSGKLIPLNFLGISSKRYVLFNLDPNGEIIIRKASAHGLGQLMAPYSEAEAPKSIPAPQIPLREIGVERWQYDFWFQIIKAHLEGHPDQVDLDYHPSLNLPAASKYAATKPALLAWFKQHNSNREYPAQVRPFNFLNSFQSRPKALLSKNQLKEGCEFKNSPKPVSPFNKNTGLAAKNCFDRETGHSVERGWLKSNIEAIAQYHLRPESKFLNGNYLNAGITKRRRIDAISTRHIGKEADQWEEQFHLGSDENAEINYGLPPKEKAEHKKRLNSSVRKFGERRIAKSVGISRAKLKSILRTSQTQELSAIFLAVKKLESKENTRQKAIEVILICAKKEMKKIGISEFAQQLKTDPSNLAKALNRERPLSRAMIGKLQIYFVLN